jgi:ribonuclease HI
VVIEDDHGMRLHGQCRWLGVATNNEAEYHALIDGLKAVTEWQPDRLEVYMDSKLVVEQLRGNYKIKKKELEVLANQAKELLGRFPEYAIAHVDRDKNAGADALANRAIDAHVKKPLISG